MMISAAYILPGTGRGTARRVVEGSVRDMPMARRRMGFGPSVSLTAATSPFRGGSVL